MALRMAEDVALTEYADLHGCSCKLGQAELDDLLASADLVRPQPELLLGVGDDAAVRSLTEELALVSTIDFFTPIIDDPYEFGRVAACNATSDAFATGATENLGALVALGLPQELTDVAPEILEGFVDALAAVDGVVTGGHTVLNPWPFAGGAITATIDPDQILRSDRASPGEWLYLTKPLGTQPAMGALRVADGEFSELVSETASRPTDHIGAEALEWMTTPNLAAATVARRYATAATDVTGFGLAGQARTLAERSGVGVELTALPVIAGTLELSALFGYGLREGESAETSGGLLLTIPAEEVTSFESDMEAADVFCRAVGRVTEGSGVVLADPGFEEISESPQR